MQFSENRHKSFSRNSCVNYYKLMKKKNYFFLISKQDQRNSAKLPIGTIIAYVDYYNKNCDLGILIWEKGKGYRKSLGS